MTFPSDLGSGISRGLTAQTPSGGHLDQELRLNERERRPLLRVERASDLDARTGAGVADRCAF